jgi:hypothetical protein
MPERHLMNIPKSFMLAGTRWTVEEHAAMGDLMGQCDSNAATIRLLKSLPDQIKAQTFCHELTHAILFTMGHGAHDEREVDAQGHLLHQFLQQFERLKG